MKELGDALKILGMEISRDRSSRQLKLSQTSYANKVLKLYGMHECKVVKTPIGAHFKLSMADSPCCEDELAYMENVPYENVVGSLMYLMVCTRPDLAYAVSLASRFISSPGKM